MLLSPIGFSPPPILGLKRLDISTVNFPPPPPSPIVKMDGDELIASVYRKIEREKALITAATNMRSSTDNPLVQQRVDANIRDGRKNIAYLEEKMQELQLRRIEHDGGSPTESRQPHGAGSASGPVPPPKDYSPGYMPNEPGDYGDGSGGFAQGGAGSMPSGAPYSDPRPFAPVPKARPNYTKLGMFPCC